MHKRTICDLALSLCTLTLAGVLFSVLQTSALRPPKVLAVTETCGNGVQEGNEGCDTANTWNVTEGGVTYKARCNNDCQVERITVDTPKPKPVVPYCCFSDGRISQCYPAPAEGDCVLTAPYSVVKRFDSYAACSTVRQFPNCELPVKTVCGDGIVQPLNSQHMYEECDEGEENSNTIANRCREDCTRPKCGDGVLDTGEECENADPAISEYLWEANAHPDCTNECTPQKPAEEIKEKEIESPLLYFMFGLFSTDEKLFIALPSVINWNALWPFSPSFNFQ